MAKPKLTDISGIGEATAAQLAKAKIHNVAALAKAAPEKLSAVPGFAAARAARVQAAAIKLLGGTPPPAARGMQPTAKKAATAKQGGTKAVGKKEAKADKKPISKASKKKKKKSEKKASKKKGKAEGKKKGAVKTKSSGKKKKAKKK
jgi:hypothetical protein